MDSISKKNELAIGDVILSYNKKTSAGNALLELNGQLLDEVKYPKLTAALGKKEQISLIEAITTSSATATVSSDDGEHCYLAYASGLYKYTRSSDSYALINGGSGNASGQVACSADGKYVSYASGLSSAGSATCKAYIYFSSDYGASFTLKQTISLVTYSPGFGNSNVFMSRDGKNTAISVEDASGAWFCASTNYGGSWVVSNRPNELYAPYDGYFISGTEDFSKLWMQSRKAYGDNAYIVESTDLGASWTRKESFGTGFTMVDVDPYDNNQLVAYQWNKISHKKLSLDGGATWAELKIPADITGLMNIIIDRGAIYIYGKITSTVYGFYTSTDLGESWVKNDLPHSIDRYAISPKRVDGSLLYYIDGNTLYKASYGALCVLPTANLSSERIIADEV
ncbi:hypothetical protein HYD28_11785 [Pseudoalteromonas shioyasakiensis]|nr:hypothetical protein HYD28_11785 [Pseudoalteromonas shioyasakiensis]